MSEEYAEKMSRKKLPELLLYVRNRTEYQEEAVLAALEELELRGQPQPEAAAIRTEFLPVVEQQRQQQQLRERELARTPVAAPGEPEPAAVDGPALYSPGTIVLFSMLPMSMMIGGGVLLGMNLFRLGHKRALLGLVLFIVVYLLVASNVLAWAMMQGLNPYLAIVLFNVPAVLAYLLWFWPRYVRTATYRSRSLIPPIVICFLVVWGLQKAMPYIIKQQPKEVQMQVEQMMKQ
ncbi:hypothetical protein [Hymenobacter sediminicola]|uniref:Uncharacterized protein n=1 Tax=Hymenobacter sediminicola TaxID=2761579 RepID=A0A7G7W6W8_9BACT|nr:hypothetical protein [Hymenobacter sediminicola]QNH62111.1 hypothetical protein H4317_18505 [Hymenobacter sediminicola]